MGKTKRGKGSKIMAVTDASGLPLAVHVASAAPHETTLVATTLAHRFTQAAPRRLLGDGAFDSDPLDEQLRARGIERSLPIAPTTPSLRPKTGEHCDATGGAGKSNGCGRGCKTSAVCWCAMIVLLTIILVSFT